MAFNMGILPKNTRPLMSAPPATNPNAPVLPTQTGEPTHIDPPGMGRSPIPGYRPEPPPIGFPLNPQRGNKRGTTTSAPTQGGVTNRPASQQPLLSGNLEAFLRQWNSGHTVMDDEMFKHFDGDSILKELQKYDPNATFSDVQQYNDGPMGRRLDFDVTKLPSITLPNGQSMKGNDMLTQFKPSQMYERLMINKNAKFDGGPYGSLTSNKNVKKDKKEWWDYVAPALIGGLPMLMAGGAMGALPRLIMSQINSLGQSGGQFNPLSLISGGLGVGGGMLGGAAGSMLSNVGRYLPLAAGAANAIRRN